MKFEKMVGLLGVSIAAAASGEGSAEINVRQVSPTMFELTTTVANEEGISDAQRAMLSTAKSICHPLGVSFGHYAFESNEQVTAGPLRSSSLLLPSSSAQRTSSASTR